MTNDKRYEERLRLLRCYGEKRKYEHILKGGNSRLDEMQAAILRVKLNYLDQWNGERRKKALIYKRMFESTEVRCPVEREQARHVYHLFTIRTKKRDALRVFLKEKGIDTLIHYPVPIHLQKAYAELGYRRGDLSVTEKVAHEILSLPFYPELTSEEMREVHAQVKNFLT